MSKKFLDTYCLFDVKTKKKFMSWMKTHYTSTPLFLYFLSINDKYPTEKSLIYKKIYGELPYDDKAMRYLSADLYSALKRFLGERKDDTYKYLSLLKNTMHLPSTIFEETFETLDSEINLLPFTTERFLLQMQTIQLAHKRAIVKSIRDDGHFSIEYLSILEEFYLQEKLRLSCVIFNNEQVYTYTKAEEVLDETLLSRSQKYVVAGFYAQLYALIVLANQDVERIFNKFLEIYNAFDTWMAREIFVILQNLCIRRLKNGDKVSEAMLLTIYKTQIAKKIILVDGSLSPWTYKNIISIAFRLKEDDWAFHFMNDFKKFVPTSEQDNVYTYNLANYYYRKKNYDKSLILLQDVLFTDTFYKIGAKWILAKIFFEKEEWTSLDYTLQSFHQLLKREKVLNNEQKKPYLNQIKQTAKLAKAYQQYTPLKNLLRSLEEEIPLAEGAWIQEQKRIFLEKKQYYYKLLKETPT